MPPRLLTKPIHLTRLLLAAKQPPPRYKFPTPMLYSLASIHTTAETPKAPAASDTSPTTKPPNPKNAERSVSYPTFNNNN